MAKEISKGHRKHAKLERPKGGDYHFNEWAIIGAPCGIIQKLARDIRKGLVEDFRIGYLDADHRASKPKEDFDIYHNDKIKYQQLSICRKAQDKQHRKYYNDLSLLLINGNHFIGAKQIVIINEEKRESLSRKIDRLTDIKMILLTHSSDEIYDFVLDQVKDVKTINIFRISEIEKICRFIQEDFNQSLPPMNGLVLAGGKSQRMGEDKGALAYHKELPQREYEAKMIDGFCHQTFISCRKNQDEIIESRYSKIYDCFEGLGPYGGILSAFRDHPNHAWLTVACDLPYLDSTTLKQLIAARNPHKLASCFYNPETDFPEPLITIWEPRAYPVLLEFLSQGYSCPRKVLINTDIEMIEMKDIHRMKNANTPEERSEAIDWIATNEA